MNKLLDSLDHITIITKKLKKTTDFYINILGMELDNQRPPFNFGGAWLSLNKRAVVHIVVNNNHITNDNKPTLDHIAFRAKDIELIKKKLDLHRIEYLEKITPDNKILQLFITDPNGIKLELSKSIE